MRLLPAALLVWFGLAFAVEHFDMGEPYPAIRMPAFRGVGSADGVLRGRAFVAEASFADGTTATLSQRELFSPVYDSNHGTLAGETVRPLIRAAPDGGDPAVPVDWALPDPAVRYRVFPGLRLGRRRLGTPDTARQFARWLRGRVAEETRRTPGEVVAVRLIAREWSVGPDGTRPTSDLVARTFRFGPGETPGERRAAGGVT